MSSSLKAKKGGNLVSTSSFDEAEEKIDEVIRELALRDLELRKKRQQRTGRCFEFSVPDGQAEKTKADGITTTTATASMASVAAPTTSTATLLRENYTKVVLDKRMFISVMGAKDRSDKDVISVHCS